ncbi:GMP synthase-like glutamine amidotransferase [Chitinophaga skermanii]|uniref:GMP synthase-like glutamine amidotransferase n=1 Tax=Chitinophaga skermanii TaxID=331697 RepID=A0A327QPH0_9BACT|nr:GMP synthase [Chitinophaga skermanii]RAJ05243.1 GMP synthase-like glutamine amidotransferase [Chitinophaga skermanii]
MSGTKKLWKIAILDMYEGVPNEGMRCIREILHAFAAQQEVDMQLDEFEVRQQLQMADTSYDVYISTGGPGSPVESEGSEWERRYFGLMNELMQWNETHTQKKYIFLICHSYQIFCRHFELGNVCKRRSPAFGVFPVHPTTAGNTEPVFGSLPDPFYIVDSRNWQVIELNTQRLAAMGAEVLAIEKERPHVPLERATMAIRFNEYTVGTQFHPEADANGMLKYLLQPAKKENVVRDHGEEKYTSMLEQLDDPDKIMLTHDKLLPAFLNIALANNRLVPA